MEFSRAYLEQEKAAWREGIQLGMQSALPQVMQLGILKERRATIESLLRFRFGLLDDQLEAIIEPVLELPPEEFTPLLLNLEREELLNRFRGQTP